MPRQKPAKPPPQTPQLPAPTFSAAHAPAQGPPSPQYQSPTRAHGAKNHPNFQDGSRPRAVYFPAAVPAPASRRLLQALFSFSSAKIKIRPAAPKSLFAPRPSLAPLFHPHTHPLPCACRTPANKFPAPQNCRSPESICAHPSFPAHPCSLRCRELRFQYYVRCGEKNISRDPLFPPPVGPPDPPANPAAVYPFSRFRESNRPLCPALPESPQTPSHISPVLSRPDTRPM